MSLSPRGVNPQAVFGEVIQPSGPLHSLSQVLGTFLLERLLSSQQIADAYSRPNTNGGYREGELVEKTDKPATLDLSPPSTPSGFEIALSQFVLKKFLLLVLFLDQAKLTRLIDYNPCLFQTSASIKVSLILTKT